MKKNQIFYQRLVCIFNSITKVNKVRAWNQNVHVRANLCRFRIGALVSSWFNALGEKGRLTFIIETNFSFFEANLDRIVRMTWN